MLPMSCSYFLRDPPGTERKDLSFPMTWASDELDKEVDQPSPTLGVTANILAEIPPM